jgi:hypothetical protein
MVDHIIDELIIEHDYHDAAKVATENGMEFTNKLISFLGLGKHITISTTRVLVYCNWCTSKELVESLYRQSEDGLGRWGDIQIVSNEPCDYYVVLNKPPDGVVIDKSRTILFRMEPYMGKHVEQWGEWANPIMDDFLWAGFHEFHHNNIEWHLSKSYQELLTEPIEKSITDTVSTVLSDKYYDKGHMKRVDFSKFVDDQSNGSLSFDVFGNNKFGYTNYKGSLPYKAKDNGLFPYKYTFNAENNKIRNYLTEKIIDGILSECVVFYWGPDISDIIDERCYIRLDLIDFQQDYETIVKAIGDCEWEKRIDVIRSEKQRILKELQFFPRIEKIILDSQ